jgi:hypothetical protein
LFGFLDLGDREGLLATLCDLVPECVPPLQGFQSATPIAPHTNGNGVHGWEEMVESGPAIWRERRRAAVRQSAAPDLRVIDRRQGVACRRKTARLGGRRRTDVGALLAAGSSSAL